MATPSLANNVATQSPLKQVNATPTKPIPLFDSHWAELSTNPSLLNNNSTAQTTRYFQDLFCLKPNSAVLSAALDQLSTEQLTREFKHNITLFFTNAVKVLKETERGDIRRANVVETLIPFLRNVLGRTYEKMSYQLMVLLAGSLERADAVFTDLVAAIDITLQDVSSSLQLRHRTLQLALVLVGGVGQGSLTAYFLRRDLFSTLVRFMADSNTAAFAYESVLLLGILANFRKREARNPYLVRIEDLVDDMVMANILDVVEQVCLSARESYTSIVDDAPPSFVASLSSLMSSLRLSELLSGFGSLTNLSLPPPVSPGPSAPGSPSFKGKGRATEEELAVPEGEALSGAGSPSGSLRGEPSRPALPPSQSADEAGPRPPLGTPRKSKVVREENAFAATPPPTVAILLPFYNLLASNDVFGQLVFVSDGKAPPALPPALISLASYVFCHAAVSARAQAYSRLALVLLMLLIEKAEEGRMTRDEVEVRLCRQRLPMLPHSSAKRPPIAAILDAAVTFLQHNLHKKLDAESYILCLRLLQRAMQQLKAERVRLPYDWVRVWRAVLTLAGFLLAKEGELVRGGVGVGKLEELMGQVFVCLSFAGYWGDAFFERRAEDEGTGAASLLMYELVHAEAVLRALATRIERHPLPGGPPTPPLPTASPGAPDGVPTCAANVLTIVDHFKGAVDDLRARTSPEEPDAGEVLAAIGEALPGLELVESSALGDLRGWREWEAVEREGQGEGAWDEGVVGVVCGDAVGLVGE